MKNINLENPNKKKGFTLAETLITLTILGVVAAITIPALINRQQEAANRTKLKKAMTMYEKALNQMIIENDLKTNQSIIDFGAEGGACANTTEYFKKVEGNGCRFKTADRIWWDISDIQNPLIILNDKNKDKEVAELKTLAKDTNDITTYAFIGRLDETTNAGIVRINDNAFEQANGTADQKAYMAKLYNLKITDNVVSEEKDYAKLYADCLASSDTSCKIDDYDFYKVSFTGNSVNLSDGQTSTPVTANSQVLAAVINTSQLMSWNEAQDACPPGTHLAKAAEIQQLYNSNSLNTLCSACINADHNMYVAAEENKKDTNYAYIFGLIFNVLNSKGPKDSSNFRVICVSE